MPDKFASIEQELQFYCKTYGEMLGIKNLYLIYKRRIWRIEKANQLPKTKISANIRMFQAGILQIEQGSDKYNLLLNLFKKIS